MDIAENLKIRLLCGLYAFTAFGLALTLKLDKPLAAIGIGIILAIIPFPVLLFARGVTPKLFDGTDKRLFLLAMITLVICWLPFFILNRMFVD